MLLFPTVLESRNCATASTSHLNSETAKAVANMEASFKFKFAFFLTYLYSYISLSLATKAVYEEITSRLEVKDTTLRSMFHKSFHQCSLGEDCNFVVKKITSNTYSLVKRAEDLPKLDGTVRIWKKIVMESKDELTNQGFINSYLMAILFCFLVGIRIANFVSHFD